MNSTEISIQTTFGFAVKFDIEAIEHYDDVHHALTFPSGSIIASDGRNPNAWLFLAYENDTSGSVGVSGPLSSWKNICEGWSGIFEAFDYPPGGNSDTSLVNVRL